jgi:hypothetical protein
MLDGLRWTLVGGMMVQARSSSRHERRAAPRTVRAWRSTSATLPACSCSCPTRSSCEPSSASGSLGTSAAGASCSPRGTGHGGGSPMRTTASTRWRPSSTQTPSDLGHRERGRCAPGCGTRPLTALRHDDCDRRRVSQRASQLATSTTSVAESSQHPWAAASSSVEPVAREKRRAPSTRRATATDPASQSPTDSYVSRARSPGPDVRRSSTCRACGHPRGAGTTTESTVADRSVPRKSPTVNTTRVRGRGRRLDHRSVAGRPDH